MDSTKRDVIDNILSLAKTEPRVNMIVERYAEKYNKPKREVIQSYINDITIDIIYEEIKIRKETEEMMKNIICKSNYVLNVY